MSALAPRPFKAPVVLFAPPDADAVHVLASTEDETLHLNVAWAHWGRDPEEAHYATYGAVEARC